MGFVVSDSGADGADGAVDAEVVAPLVGKSVIYWNVK
jgi:hypothetical protein